MTDIEQSTTARLLEKSQEAFLLAVELYNRPTIKYHVEGCAFFISNAWELMLKAHLIKRDGLESIYYPDNHRTISLEDCLSRVFTNVSDPLRANMKKVVDLRNTSTHFVVQEYEFFYGPILQACVENYDTQMRRLHGVEISDLIPENYLGLSVKRAQIDEDECRARYSTADMDKMLRTMEGILSTADELDSTRFSCTYVTELRTTKRSDADLAVRINKDAETPAAIVKELIQPKNKYPFRPSMVVKEINRRLKKHGVALMQGGEDASVRRPESPFNMYHFGLFRDVYSMKNDPRYSYNNALPGDVPAYIYSQQAVDLIWNQIRSDPTHIIDRLKLELKKGSA